jgi:hypothetical protein
MLKVKFVKIFNVLVFTFFILLLIHVIFYTINIVTGADSFLFLKAMQMFDMNDEQNLPTLYNTFILLISSFLLMLIASNEEKRRDRILWSGMALIFLYIGVDDFTTIHEGIYFHLVPDYQGSGFLKYGWVIPYGILLIIVLIVYIPHIFRLPKPVRNKIILAGAVFVTGGFVLELVGGYFIDNGYPILFRVAVTLEESGEMIGILIFIHALIKYIKLESKAVAIQL